MSGFCVEVDRHNGETDFYSVCFVCHLDLNTLDSSALKEAHLNSCLNAMESTVVSDQAPLATEWSRAKGEGYGQDEVDDVDILMDFRSILDEHSETSSSGLRSKDFTCIICDLDLSRRQVTARCQHLKRYCYNNLTCMHTVCSMYVYVMA